MEQQTRNVSDKHAESGQSPPQNTTNHNLLDDIHHSHLDYNSLNSDLSQQLNETIEHFDYRRMCIEQGNAVMDLKMSEYKKALAERDSTIRSLLANMTNSKNHNYILISQYKNLMDKTKSVSNNYNHLNISFTNMCERFNTLGETVDNAKTRQQEVMDLVSQTTKTFQEKILNISNNIEDLFKRMKIQKVRANQELEILENKYSVDLIACKTSIEEFTNEINNLKSQNVMLLEKLNETNMKLNKEKEITLNLNQHFEKELKLMDDQKIYLINQNKSINSKFDEIQFENQSLKDEVVIMKNSLDESKKKLDEQLSKIKEFTELVDTFKKSEALHDTIKTENFALKEHNEHLERINTDLMNDINNKEISMNKIEEEKENEFKKMCKNYDDLIKMQEEKLMDITQQLKFQKENENKIQSDEVLHLKQEIEICNNTIESLQEEGKANKILVPELQNKIEDLNANLNNTHKKLNDTTNDFLMEKNILKEQKIALEQQGQEHFKQIEKLTMNYMKYKSKAKQLYVEVMRLRSLSSQLGQKKIQLPPAETNEAMNDGEENNVEDIDDSIFDFNDPNNLNVSTYSTSSKVNQKSIYSGIKRNSSFVIPGDKSIIKKHRTADNLATSQRKVDFIQNTKENIELNKANLKLTPLKKNIDVNNKVNKQAVNLNTTSNLDPKKTFRIPADLRSPQKTKKPGKMQKDVLAKPNSPVTLTALSSKQN